jgi:hypothetical protein
MHISTILSTVGLASLALAGPVQLADRQAQKLRISMIATLTPRQRPSAS